MASQGSYIKHIREKELILCKSFLRIGKVVKGEKKHQSDMRKENSQAILLMGMKNSKLNIRK